MRPCTETRGGGGTTERSTSDRALVALHTAARVAALGGVGVVHLRLAWRRRKRQR